jgi:FtsP/CotA-like multicopper oxidase with cupredoxin domain
VRVINTDRGPLRAWVSGGSFRVVAVDARDLSGPTDVTGTGVVAVDAEPGERVRLRVVNTDYGPLRAWVTGSPFTVLAVDGTDVNEPTELRDEGLVVTAGGRVDVLVEAPARLDTGGGSAVVVGPPGTQIEPRPAPDEQVDLLSYGTPRPLSFDPERPDRRFTYAIGRRIGFVDGRPGFWWTINGRLFPDVPMFHVEEGDVVRMTIRNDSGDVHPMHLHGHHAIVLSRDGVAATGSPWVVDSLNVLDGETYEIVFLADNPGIWMDHCHHLDHAAEGLVAHLAYAGVAGSYEVGGPADNHPE